MFTFASKLSANPMIGRQVLYMLHAGDAAWINQARATIRKNVGSTFEYDPAMEAENAIRTAEWQEKSARLDALRALSQGNGAEEGQILPAFIVTQWTGSANLQVFLDGNDVYWATSRSQYRGDEAPVFDPQNWHYSSGRWHIVQKGATPEDADLELTQKDIINLLDAAGGDWLGGDEEALREWLTAEHGITLSWEPDARGTWVFAD